MRRILVAYRKGEGNVKEALYLSVNVFSTKVLIEEVIIRSHRP